MLGIAVYAIDWYDSQPNVYAVCTWIDEPVTSSRHHETVLSLYALLLLLIRIAFDLSTFTSDQAKTPSRSGPCCVYHFVQHPRTVHESLIIR